MSCSRADCTLLWTSQASDGGVRDHGFLGTPVTCVVPAYSTEIRMGGPPGGWGWWLIGGCVGCCTYGLGAETRLGTESGTESGWGQKPGWDRKFDRNRPSLRGRPSRPSSPSARRPANRPARDLQDGRGQQDRTGDKPRQLHLQSNMLCRRMSPLQLAQHGRALRRWLRIAGS